MDMYSPSKRRALAPLDANAKPTLTPKHHKLERPTTFPSGAAPLRLFPEGSSRKRGFEDASVEGLGGKKACLSRDEVIPRSRSQSPDTSSVFDTSGNDASWATAATDDAVERVIARPRAMTRDEAREKAEILRLRLGLANYKLRTNQIDVPLADLQPKPLPRAGRVVRVQSPSSSPVLREQIHLAQEQIQIHLGGGEETEEEEESSCGDTVVIEEEEEDQPMPMPLLVGVGERTATPVSGGAATGLLHLARDSSS